MALILTIDTANTKALVGLFKEGILLRELVNDAQRDHAAFLQVAIKEIFTAENIQSSDLDYIISTSGPGSYTGLRVGMASAKGLAYALDIPLILLNTLDVMALAAIEEYSNQSHDYWYCPMIEAKRADVFLEIVNHDFSEYLIHSQPFTLDSDSFRDILSSQKIIFSGSGATKAKEFIKKDNAIFSEVAYSSKHLLELGKDKIEKKEFADVAYSEPNYYKEFYSTQKKH